MTRYQVIAHRRASSVFGAASAPVKEGDEILPPFRSRCMAEALARGLDAKVGTPHVYHTVEEVRSAETPPVRDYVGLEIARMLVLTTAHLTPETANQMTSLPTAIFEKADYGFFAYAAEDTDRLPTGLEGCIHYARSRSCEWLMFDCDGPRIEGLPVFDWEEPALRIDPTIPENDEQDGQAFFDAAACISPNQHIEALDYPTAALLWRAIRAAPAPDIREDRAGTTAEFMASRLREDARALDTGMDPELVRELHAEADRLDNKLTIDSMAEELRIYCREHHLPEYSADDLLFLEGLTEAQRTWLRDFCDRWECMIRRTESAGGDDAVH